MIIIIISSCIIITTKVGTVSQVKPLGLGEVLVYIQHVCVYIYIYIL